MRFRQGHLEPNLEQIQLVSLVWHIHQCWRFLWSGWQSRHSYMGFETAKLDEPWRSRNWIVQPTHMRRPIRRTFHRGKIAAIVGWVLGEEEGRRTSRREEDAILNPDRNARVCISHLSGKFGLWIDLWRVNEGRCFWNTGSTKTIEVNPSRWRLRKGTSWWRRM